MEPSVVGIVLRVETRGWSGPPPPLPKPPISAGEGADGLRFFIYDLTPAEAGLSLPDACLRLGSRLERMLNSPKSPFPEGHYALRARLEIGILADRESESFGYAWPPEFLQTLVDGSIELSVTHYLPMPDAGGGAQS